MKSNVKLRPEALREFNESADWYDARQSGLGVKYVNAIDATLELIAKSPGRYGAIHKDVRVISVKGFPYHIYYRKLEDDSVEVISVFHVRQNPAIWKKR